MAAEERCTAMMPFQTQMPMQYDPLLALLMMPLYFPLMLMQYHMMMMQAMMQGTRPTGGMKLVEIRRDAHGSIIEILERG